MILIPDPEKQINAEPCADSDPDPGFANTLKADFFFLKKRSEI
jgi:hypothetical protein